MKKPPGKLKPADLARSVRFRRLLMKWDLEENRRAMPWKGEKDPYRIWLSEIVLQQTRVEQGLKYYERLLAAFPTFSHLAAAPQEEVFRVWEGLGYYSRCRNLISTAREVVASYNGKLPEDYETILSLKGIGPYTAAAISSFAFNRRHAVLDGNVYRVLSRIHAVSTPSDSIDGKKLFTQLAASALSPTEPARYNQAIMDFGATICKPVPLCHHCFFRKHCEAYQQEKQLLFPVRAKTLVRKERWLNYIVVRSGTRYAIRKRSGRDIWQDLYEFLLLETPSKPTSGLIAEFIGSNIVEAKPVGQPFTSTQRLTHQIIHFRFVQFEVQDVVLPGEFVWVTKKSLAKYPFPRTLREYISSELI